MNASGRYRNVCITSYDMSYKPELTDKMSFICGQHELCPTTNRDHWQIYVEFKDQVSLKQLQKIWPGGHFEARKAKNPEDAAQYCQDDETYVDGRFRFGTISKQGKRTDLEEVQRDIDAGFSIADVAREHFTPFCRYHKSFEKYISLTRKPTGFTAKEVFYIFGPPGCGKTRFVYESNPSVFRPVEGDRYLWFDNYAGEECILLDDMDLHRYERGFLLKLLDGYPFQLPTKGGSVYNHFKRIYITSNFDPKFNCFAEQAMLRRLTRVIDMNPTPSSNCLTPELSSVE